MRTREFLELLNDKLGVKITEDHLRDALIENTSLKADKVGGVYQWCAWHAVAVANHFGINLSLEMSDVIGDVRISTIDLRCMEHPGGTFYETMVFGPNSEDVQSRYRTKKEAVAGHLDVVADVVAKRRKK